MAFLTEADTCRRYVLPELYAVGWTDEQISEQKSFTDGRIVVTGDKVRRLPQKRADYILRYRRDFPIAVVEAKSIYANPGDGLQQAKGVRPDSRSQVRLCDEWARHCGA